MARIELNPDEWLAVRIAAIEVEVPTKKWIADVLRERLNLRDRLNAA
jgi:hypothetical protein